MRKIQTIFKRDDDNEGRIIDEYAVDPELFAIGIATEKIDGTNIRVTVRSHTVVRVEKRRNPDKMQKQKGIKEPWYVDASESAEDKWIMEAIKGTDYSGIPDGEWSGEAIGPNIQGNPLNLESHRVLFFTLNQAPVFDNVPTDFNGLREWLPLQKSKYGKDCGIEGIVWHCSNGEMIKIKTKDFK